MDVNLAFEREAKKEEVTQKTGDLRRTIYKQLPSDRRRR